MGRTPGAYGFVVSCDTTGYVGPDEVVTASMFVLNRDKGTALTPLSPKWWFPGGTGPATLEMDMVSYTSLALNSLGNPPHPVFARPY